MFITPYFGGCKYTNNFLFINKNIEFQWLGLLITPDYSATTLLLLLSPDIFTAYTWPMCITFCIFERWISGERAAGLSDKQDCRSIPRKSIQNYGNRPEMDHCPHRREACRNIKGLRQAGGDFGPYCTGIYDTRMRRRHTCRTQGQKENGRQERHPSVCRSDSKGCDI